MFPLLWVMSNNIREEWSSSEYFDKYGYRYVNECSYGNATQSRQMFHVRWGWLAYPVAVTVIALIFMIATVIVTRHDEIWKSSTLAMMFHSFNDRDKQRLKKEFGDLNMAELMAEVTREQKVRLNADIPTGIVQFEAGTRHPRKRKGSEMWRDKVADGLGDVTVAVSEGINGAK